MPAADLANGRDFGAGQRGAAGVMRVVQQQHAAIGRDRGFQRGGGQVKAPRRVQRHRHQFGARRAHDGLIGGVIGIGDQHLVARPDQRHHRRVKRGLRAGDDQHILGRDLAAAALAVFRRQRRQQFRLAPAVGIAGAAGAHGGIADIQQAVIGGDVRLADGQLDHRLALGRKLAAAQVNIPFARAKARQPFGDRRIAHSA